MTDETTRFIWTGVFAAIPAILAYLAMKKVGEVKVQTTKIENSVNGTHTKLEEKLAEEKKTLEGYRTIVDQLLGAGALSPKQEGKVEELAKEPPKVPLPPPPPLTP